MNGVIDQTYDVKSITYNSFHDTDEEYQRYVIRIMSMQAYAEKLGAEEMGYQLRLAPDSLARRSLACIVRDEADHALMLYRILEKLGVSEESAIQIAQGKADGSKATASMDGAIAVGDDDNEWIDLVLNNMLMDRAGGFIVSNFMRSSFEPWSTACEKIYEDEKWHKRFGLDQLVQCAKSNKSEKLRYKFTVWFCRALNFFGPPSVKTQKKLCYYGIKRKSNEELRSEFVDEVKFLMEKYNLSDLLLPGLPTKYPYQFQLKSYKGQ